ncbi:helicase-exonuclease AddAB subunit AddB [Alkalicoccus daliensis]|uniref:DNA helicase/exodeoxyribonuclease V, subunit B n=1 Tax=Alkalicoccus daliensis TaxID=745820 RepID=A0A1H0ALN7_9BACI|nr:helicase-exonuclease AddAB subunit AddB [Alkalicoccus daliensis]SDN34377.1 DNA helicase/exodeoxyribonuclease V, subunit B [Alkalicoccus daliensis]
MAINIYTGRSGTGKSYEMHTEIIQRCTDNPDGSPIVLLVPDQMTFQTDRELLLRAGKGLTRVRVLSFTRLAYLLLQQEGGITKKQISKTGIHALIRKVAAEAADNLELYGNSITSRGFITQLERMLTECKRYDLTCETMQQIYDELLKSENLSASERKLKAKLHDFLIIQNAMEKTLQGVHVEEEDLLNMAAEKIKNGAKENTDFYVDGFHSFTPIEMNVIDKLIQSADFHIALTADKIPAISENLQPLDLFYEPVSTIQTILQLAEEADVPCYIKQFNKQKRFISPELEHLEKDFNSFPPRKIVNNQVNLWEAVHPRAEVEHTAREIFHLIKKKEYRYKDIAVISRDINRYKDYVETIFPLEDIPYFTDSKRSAEDHPLTEFIKSSLEAVEKNWPYEAMFRLIKTEFLFSNDRVRERELADQLENYVLAYGIRGKRWYDQKPWNYRFSNKSEQTENEEEDTLIQDLESMRKKLTEPVLKLQEKLKTAVYLKEYAQALYDFVEAADIPEKLEEMSREAIEKNNLKEAAENEQMWKETIQLLDDIVEVSGEEKVTLSIFRDMIDSGLESMKFSIIPPAFDQVVLGDAETSRLSNIKILFLLGMNDGVFPRKPEEEGFLTEEERNLMERTGMNLAPGAEAQLLGENYLFYRAVTQPEERLYVSYSLQDADGKNLQPSLFTGVLTERLEGLQAETKFESPHEHETEHEKLFVTNEDRSLSYLTVQLQQWKNGYAIHPLWWDVYNWFAEKNPSRRFEVLVSSLFYKNLPDTLKKGTAEKIYGKRLKASVSRFEQYNACPFSQYAKYGLKLKERAVFKLEAPDIGLLFHDALKDVSTKIMKERGDIRELSKAEVIRYSDDIVEALAPQIQREIFQSSDRYKYILHKLKNVVSQAAVMMAEQSKRSEFVPAGWELGFGKGETLPPLSFKLANGALVEVVGRIDRVDKAETASGVYLRIVDYKSSDKDIKLEDIYYGLSMQMLVYLDVVLTHSYEWLHVETDAAGVLYFHVHNPMLKSDKRLTLDQIEKEILKQFKMKGLLSADPEVISATDTSLSNGSSEIAPIHVKKDGTHGARSKVLGPDNYELLRHFVRRQMKQYAEKIAEGDISLTPYKKKQHVPCTYCSYRSFCQFDQSLETNKYRVLKSKSEEEVMLKIQQEGGVPKNEG